VTVTRAAHAKSTAGTLALLCLAGCAAAAALWYFYAPGGAPPAAPRSSARGATAAASFEEVARYGPASAPALPSLPSSLSGSIPPRLPLDARGHLRKARGVRDFFDYFLTAQSELPADALDALVRKHIAAQLDGTAAQMEALDVWQRYMAYRQAISRLAPFSVPSAVSDTSSSGGPDFDVMQPSLDLRASVASRTLGAEWSEAFFDIDWRRGRYAIERLRIVRDPALTDAQKASRLQALDETVPPEARGALQAGGRARAAVDTVAKLEQQGMSPAQLRTEATQALGPEAAERIVKLQQDEDAWRAKYADYAAQRTRIDAMGLAPADRQAQIEQLRRRVFANSREMLRAASLDSTNGTSGD
jgi:lipase chaperone LimK